MLHIRMTIFSILKFDDMIQNMAKYIDAENDYLFIRGKKETEERIIINLLAKMSLTLDQVADIAGVSVEFVKNIKQKISSDKER
jgi:predicted HTH domain antitoxin